MSNSWKELDTEQKREAPPSTCRYCGDPIYWETLHGGKKQPVNATDLESHRCSQYETKKHRPRKEAEMPTDKGHCKHGEFNLTEGCPQCMAEKQAGLEPAPELIGVQLAEEADIVEAEDESYRAPYNASYHAPYRLQDGAIVPGVTTVLNILDKGEQLQDWIWKCGQQGIDYRDIRDAAGRVGTIAHYLIACHLKEEKADVARHSPDEVNKAEKCFEKYLAWEKESPLTPVMIEAPLVSEEYKYGGTLDLLAEINGEFVLTDFKTSGRIYDSHYLQVAAYRKLLEEQGWPVAGARILRISPNDDQYEVGIQRDFEKDWEIFQHALAIWQLQTRN